MPWWLSKSKYAFTVDYRRWNGLWEEVAFLNEEAAHQYYGKLSEDIEKGGLFTPLELKLTVRERGWPLDA